MLMQQMVQRICGQPFGGLEKRGSFSGCEETQRLESDRPKIVQIAASPLKLGLLLTDKILLTYCSRMIKLRGAS